MNSMVTLEGTFATPVEADDKVEFPAADLAAEIRERLELEPAPSSLSVSYADIAVASQDRRWRVEAIVPDAPDDAHQVLARAVEAAFAEHGWTIVDAMGSTDRIRGDEV